MRLRLFHKLALFTSLLLAVTIVAIAGAVIRQVSSGFNSYLDERDDEQLKAFALVIADGIQQGKYDAANLGMAMPRLLDEQAMRQGGNRMNRPRLPPFPPGPGENPGGPGPGGPPIETMPGAGFGGRIAILSVDGHVLAGHAFSPGGGVIEEPVVVNGHLVARVQLMKLHRASEDLDRRFLRDQVKGIAVASGLAFVVAFCGILWFSQRLAQPLRAAQLATGRISQGDFNIRLPEGGADEIADLVRNINAMAGSLEKLEHSRKNWLAQLSHELRTPLTGLQGGCEAMLDGVRPVSVEGIALLHERVLAIKRIVEDLHTVSLADLGSLPHVFTEMDAVAAIKHVLEGIAPRVKSGDISIEFENSLTSLPVCWDEGRIRQLLENLLENSLRYTDAPGRIAVHLTDIGESVTLRWEDSAPGVPSQDLERVFEPLYRADAARSRKLGGSGLGLAICRAIVSAHFGKISATASPLGGVCIHITLPKNPSRP
jgi:two-component system sensor histidine kinase BaeS